MSSKYKAVELVLCLSIIICLFLPYCFNITPWKYMFNSWGGPNLMMTFAVIVPVFLIIPFGLLHFLKSTNPIKGFKFIRAFFYLVHLLTLVPFLIILKEILGESEPFLSSEYGPLIGLVLGSLLLISNFRSKISDQHKLQNIMVCSITTCYCFFLFDPIAGFSALEYGGILINLTFILLYILAWFKTNEKEIEVYKKKH